MTFRLILEHLVKERTDVDFVTIHGSSDVAPDQIIHKINQVCLTENLNCNC